MVVLLSTKQDGQFEGENTYHWVDQPLGGHVCEQLIKWTNKQRSKNVASCQVRELGNPGEIYQQCMGMMARLAELGLVHCDFNEFNLLVSHCDSSCFKVTSVHVTCTITIAIAIAITITIAIAMTIIISIIIIIIIIQVRWCELAQACIIAVLSLKALFTHSFDNVHLIGNTLGITCIFHSMLASRSRTCLQWQTEWSGQQTIWIFCFLHWWLSVGITAKL